MPLLILALPLIIVLVVLVLMPLTVLQRYRMGTARRRARSWVATLNVLGLSLSSILFFIGAALTAMWVPDAFTSALAGFTGGCLLGAIGLSLSRWESGPGSLHYTPNRWLVLGITLIVTARLAFGLVRTWRAWHTTTDYASWAVASGAAGSLAAGAVVLGYYVTYWLGVRRRLRRHGA